MLTIMLLTLVSTFLQVGFGLSIDLPDPDVIKHQIDYYDYDTSTPQSPALEYNDSLIEGLLDSPYSSIHRYDLSKDELQQRINDAIAFIFGILDKDTDGIISKREMSSPSVELNDVNEAIDFVFEAAPVTLGGMLPWWYVGDMRPTDINEDGFLSIEEIENSLMVVNEEQKQIIRELFNYFDENNDNQLSLDDFKPKLKKFAAIYFKIYDTNSDGIISLDDMNLKIQWDDMTSILSLIKEELMQNGEFDFNHYLIPFGLDLNEDGIMNNFDLYLSTDTWDYDWVLPLAKVLKLLDQDQDGVFTFNEIRDFVVTLWNILDANNDMNISLDDGYLLLKNKLNVDSNKVSTLENYINDVKAYAKREGVRLAEFIFQAIDRNDDGAITLQEFYQMPQMCFNSWRDETCFQNQRFPDTPRTLDGEQFFPQSKYFRTRRYRLWEQRMTSFLFSSLDSPKFYKPKEFDWDGAAEIEAKIEGLAPRGEELLNELRHKVSAYKQVLSYLNDNELETSTIA